LAHSLKSIFAAFFASSSLAELDFSAVEQQDGFEADVFSNAAHRFNSTDAKGA
jgi:hypothetical protein